MSVSRTVVITWLSISLFLMIRLLVNISRTAIVWGRRTQALLFAEQPHRRIAAVLEGIGDNNAVVPIQISDAVMVPVVVGLFHPTIVLPAEVAQWPDGQLKLVLQHELAHVRRRDIFWNCFVSVVSAIIWFQPLAWIVQRKLRDDQEFACDDAVLLQGNGATEYAAMLVNVAESLLIRQCPVSSVAMAGCCSVERRIHAILDTSTRRSETQRQRFTWITGVTIILIILTATCCGLVPQLAFAGEKKEPIFRDTAISTATLVSSPINGELSENTISKDEYRIRQRVIDESGKAVSGATVSVEGRNLSLSPVTTDSNGWFEIAVPAAPDSPPIVFSSWASGYYLRTVGPSGDKLCFTHYPQLRLDRRMDLERHLKDFPDIQLKPTCMQKVLVNDPEQQPVANAFVGVVMRGYLVGLSKTDAQGVASVQRMPQAGEVFTLKDNMGFDFCYMSSVDIAAGEAESIGLTLDGARPVKVRLVTPTEFGRRNARGDFSESDRASEESKPLADIRLVPSSLRKSNGVFWTSLLLNSSLAESLCPKTNADGEATIGWMPTWQNDEFELDVVGEGLAPVCQSFVPNDANQIQQITVDRLIEVQGRVVDRAGKPIAAAVVHTMGLNWEANSRFANDDTRTSDAEGNFSMVVAPRQELFLQANTTGQVSPALLRTIVPLQSPIKVELSFSGTNCISGILSSGPDRTPLPGRLITLIQMIQPAQLIRTGQLSSFFQGAENRGGAYFSTSAQTDEHGRYEIQLGDGEWHISDPFDHRTFDSESVTLRGEFQVQKDFHSDDMTLLRTTIISAATQEEVDGVVYISGVTQPQLNAGYHLISRKPHMVEVSSSAGKAFTVWDGQSDEMQMFVAPVVTASGQLVDDKGMPLPDRSIRYMILPSLPAGTQRTKEFSYGNSGQIETDENGKFTLSNFIQGCEGQVMATNDEGIEWAKQRWTVLKAVVPTTDDPIDLGQLKISLSMSAE